MTENPTPNTPPQLTERDAELLSAYIDDMLTDDERATLEARLSAEPFLARELAAMRQTVAWINTLPTMQAPRNFTLTIEQAEAIRPAAAAKASVSPKTTSPASTPEPKRTLQFPVSASWAIGSAAALIVLIFGTVLLLNPGTVTDTANVASAPADQEAAEIAQQATATPITSPTLLATSSQGGRASGVIEPTKEPAIVTPMTNTGGAVPETAAEADNAIQATPIPASTAATLNDDADTDEVAEFDIAAADSAEDDSADAPIAEASSDEEDAASDFDDEGVTEVQAVEEAETIEEEALEAEAADADFAEDTIEAETTEVLTTADDATTRSTGVEATAETVPSPLQDFVDFVITFLTTLTEILDR